MEKFNCKNCGAEITFDAATQKLKCKYCDSEFDISEYQTSEDKAETEPAGSSGEQGEPRAADEGSRATDESEKTDDLVVYQCSHCGAEVITSKSTVATTCAYCNRPITISSKLVGDFRPKLVIPFSKTEEDVKAAYTKLCKRSILTPKEFKAKNMIKKVKGMYIPFWLHSMMVTTNISADCKNIKTWRSGDTEYTKTDSYMVTMSARGDFDNIPTDALTHMDNDLMDSIEPFDYKAMKPFDTAYLAGYYTEQYDEDSNKTLARAQSRAENTMADKMLSEAGAYTTKTIKSKISTYKDSKSDYAMLPVWIMRTNYKNKDYTFGMNGQTGKMVGKIPVDKLKAFLFGLGGFAAAEIVILILKLVGIL